MQGFLNLNKPLDVSSHGCVARARRILGIKKVGHGGTLDPKATGVLPVAVGRATRLLQYLPEAKAYRGVVRFGLTTTTDDLEGEVLTRQTAPGLTIDQVSQILAHFRGDINQRPPHYSAIQVDGQRLYTLARKGKVVEAPLRQVHVQSLEVVDWRGGEFPEATLDIDCGPGTYIRAIARDLGQHLGVGATLVSLVRTHSNGFDLTNSLTLEDLESRAQAGNIPLLSPEAGVRHLSAIPLDKDQAKRWRQGQKICVKFQGEPEGPYRVVTAQENCFLGIGQIQADEDMLVLVHKVVFEPYG